MTHAAYHKVSMGFNNVVALDHKNLHTLPPGIYFFRVDGPTIVGKISVTDTFVFCIQVTNSDAIETTLACLTADCHGIVVNIAALDKFVHKQRNGIGEMLGRSVMALNICNASYEDIKEQEKRHLEDTPLAMISVPGTMFLAKQWK
jgi:hypothetical protein